jgi:hypothetical protein
LVGELAESVRVKLNVIYSTKKPTFSHPQEKKFMQAGEMDIEEKVLNA